MTAQTEIADRFVAKFGALPSVYRAPGRVNLIGEHTDYNDGFVMPAAIGFYCWVAIGRREDGRLVIQSEEFSGRAELDLDSNLERLEPSHAWSDYPIGVALQLRESGFPIGGANLLIHGEVPMGAGLSSSAAIEVATALALCDRGENSIDRTQLARICQRAENQFVGTQSGIMDQFISLHGRHDHALMLDCRSMEFELLPVPESVRLVICDTGVKHEHAAGEYNRRRAECDEAVHRLAAVMPGIRALRDVSELQLQAHRQLLSDVTFRRALHVVTENARVLHSAEALRSGNLQQFGQYMAESHRSLRDLYEVSCRELDLMVDIANHQSGLYGARMTGGGFGGSTINLVEADRAEGFAENVALSYRQATGISPQTYICMPADGASRVNADVVTR
jgi:galactokinase